MLTEIKNGNVVKVEGILSEMDLTSKQFTSKINPNDVYNAITGSFIVRVDDPKGEKPTSYIKISVFAKEFTKAGKPNPQYSQFENLIKNGVSVAVGGIDNATCVRVSGGRLSSNDYYNKQGALVSSVRVEASFVDIIARDSMQPSATFSTIFMVGSKGFEVDKDGIETDRYKVVGMIPRFNGEVDVINFVVLNPNAIDAISSYWNEGDTVKAEGRLVHTMEEVTSIATETASYFGEAPEQKKYTRINRDFVITRGTPNPLEGEFAINYDDVKEALARRKARLEAEKVKKNSANASSGAPKAKNFSDFGF